MIDNNANTFYASQDPTVSQTLLWVQLELSHMAAVDNVQIINRKDGFGNRTSNVKIMVGTLKIDNKSTTKDQKHQLENMSVCGIWPGKGRDGQVIEIHCHTRHKGTIVTVQVLDPRSTHMNIAEIMVYGQGMRIRIFLVYSNLNLVKL